MTSMVNVGGLEIYLDSNDVRVNGMSMHLTGKEYLTLRLLALKFGEGTVVTHRMFLNHLYGGVNEPEFKTLKVFICKLREKLSEATKGKEYIELVWGRGYRLIDPEAKVNNVVTRPEVHKYIKGQKVPCVVANGNRPTSIRLLNGRLLSLSDLPRGYKIRWVAKHKATVVLTIICGLIGEEEICLRYHISPEELKEWMDLYVAHGQHALQVKSTQKHPHTPTDPRAEETVLSSDN